MYIYKINEVLLMTYIKKGNLLISEPTNSSDTFFKSIILIVEHKANETIGLVLNEPTELYLNKILEDFPIENMPIFNGGPVEKNLIQFIHNIEKVPKSKEIVKGLYWGGDLDYIYNLIRIGSSDKENIKFFSGYSGWERDQLYEEIKYNSWVMKNPDINICMQQSDHNLWNKIVKLNKSEYYIWSNMPKDPNMN